MKELLTPCIVQTIIICCTIIIIALVVLSGYRIKKQLEQSWHGYVFIASILTILAIIIFSYAFYGNRKVLDFISLASALISIILAIVTIIYSFYTNGSSIGQAEKLQEAAERVQQASEAYSESAGSLQENIQRIITVISRVEAKTDRLLDANNVTHSKNANIFSQFDLNNYIEGYIGSASPLGIVAIYACIKSKDSKKSFPLNILGSKENGLYIYGFLVATVSSGLLSLDIDFEKDNITANQYIEPLKEYTNKKLEEYKSIDAINDSINEVDKYFSK